jgi:hypothetical protein
MAQPQALTRLQFLANPEVLELAFKLRHIEDQLYSIVFTEPLKSGEWQGLRTSRGKYVSTCKTRVAGT